ncbi:prolipoprotein diacylglyceryl transferase [Staphylococcus aureus]|jgi:prolipoprotein diacylglyceryl transferase|uniref:Phosphatidylglycerol--prolipoprotein diacylglyceryl transferase n=4 Tax=Staphylococcus aureus TaxID=1280 RepID=LGT_STAAW|nr:MULTISPECIES: prolipoprotein diacylglyceryl transferase [Staphylococcus]Q6GB69.1 RecName: Full=Phosphatidylglycerol--prolipoprotein diacylglyceryl transferase [Staphylococcus aureus subsp. aureus MSSA476]Q8NXL8.1 RecName: Full=Phosphatidylglycerol--prolipoprotein diacylglyceryl transferase [Staphylococcus aureus subsp. aureus MW2]EHS19272.1 prolipoprotein diacylglyceryl transferase [Staphylococcus aureus subsp. aureus IS-55]ETO53606.1 prolipoprotein diacylglyceryl transferase [Staphylococcus
MGIVFNYIDPVAFNLGPLSVRWYGIIIAVGILLGYFVAQRALVKAGLHKDTLVDIIFYSALFGFIAARIYFVIFQWPYYVENPSEIIKIWHGGIAIHGGLIGGFIAGVIVCKVKNLNPFQIGDIVAPSIILAQGIGRWGNFMNHEAHGGPVSRAFLEKLHLPNFIIENMYINGQYYHPTFLYESIWDVAGFIILVNIRKHLKLGETFFLYLTWYSIGRFFIEGLRTDSLMLTSNIRVAQLVSILLILISISLIVYRRIKYNPPLYSKVGALPWPTKKVK